jgi:hypothetical protein
MNKEVHIQLVPVNDRIKITEEVRTGALPAIKDLITLKIVGTILAPFQYLDHMNRLNEVDKPVEGEENTFRIDRSLTHALVDLENQRIRLNVNKNKEYNQGYQAIIAGELMLSGDLKRFNINEDDEMSPRKMADKLKRLKIFFKDPNQNHEIVSALMNLVGKSTKDFSRSEDNRGNLKASLDKKVNTNLPETFTLSVPIFEGFPPLTFQVEIGVDERDGGLSVWLESTELFSLMIEMRDKAISTEVAALEKNGILVLFVNPGAKE